MTKTLNLPYLLVILLLGLAACSSKPKIEDQASEPPPLLRGNPQADLIRSLGMIREPDDLGYAEKSFNPCALGMQGNACRAQYFSVVHFQLLCRDSEGSVSEIGSLQPIVADNVRWEIGSQKGGTHTDAQGYGQFTLVSDKSTRGKRLILRIGPQFVAFSVSDVSKVVLPKNFCRA